MSQPESSQPKWYALAAEDVAKQLQVDPAKGLSANEAQTRLQQYGSNKLAAKKKESGRASVPAPVQGFHADHPVGAASLARWSLREWARPSCWWS